MNYCCVKNLNLPFKTGRLKEAEKKAFETFRSNTYLFDIFFGRQVKKIEKWEGSNLQTQDFAEKQFSYNIKQNNLHDFSVWLDNFIATEKFILLSTKYLDIQKRLTTERDTETRRFLIQQEQELENEL
jgi:hypothetical protein